MLSFSLVAEALTGLIYHRPLGENLSFVVYTFLMMGEASLETSPKNNMIQDMINSDDINYTESTMPNIFKTKMSMRSATRCATCSALRHKQ